MAQEDPRKETAVPTEGALTWMAQEDPQKETAVPTEGADPE